MAFSPDGRYLVTGRANGTVQVWDARTGQRGRHARHPRPAGPGGGVQPATAGTWLRRAATGRSNCGTRPALDEKQEASPHPPSAQYRAWV